MNLRSTRGSHRMPYGSANWSREFQAITTAVADTWKITLEQLLSRTRVERIASARMVAMFLMTELTRASHREIGLLFERDHGTVSHDTATIRGEMDVYPEFRELLATLKQNLQSSLNT